MDERIKNIMADILDIEKDVLLDDFRPEDTTNWDSLNNLRMVTAIEEEFQIKLSMDDIKKMVSYGKIKSIVFRYL